jgi:hypothetical protein
MGYFLPEFSVIAEKVFWKGRCVFSSGVEQHVREADLSAPSSTEVKNAWLYTSIPPYVFTA